MIDSEIEVLRHEKRADQQTIANLKALLAIKVSGGRKLIAAVTVMLVPMTGGYIAFVQGQISESKAEQAKAKEASAQQASDIAVVKEQIRTLQKDTTEIKDGQKDVNKKLDELLRRR